MGQNAAMEWQNRKSFFTGLLLAKTVEDDRRTAFPLVPPGELS
jgi:hypothetical protein